MLVDYDFSKGNINVSFPSYFNFMLKKGSSLVLDSMAVDVGSGVIKTIDLDIEEDIKREYSFSACMSSFIAVLSKYCAFAHLGQGIKYHGVFKKDEVDINCLTIALSDKSRIPGYANSLYKYGSHYEKIRNEVYYCGILLNDRSKANCYIVV